MASEVSFLNYKINSQGLHLLPEKVRAVEKATTPKNVTELKAYLMYYGHFLPNLPTVLSPLYRLLRKDVQWRWTANKAAIFKSSTFKQLLTSVDVLVHYNLEFELVVASDASSYGIGAVLLHKLPSDEEKPIAFASRSLSAAECNYSQLDKEALSCIFAVKSFTPTSMVNISLFRLITNRSFPTGIC